MKSIREITTYKWIIKKSEFICTLIPCNDEEKVNQIIHEYQEKYHDATHNCIAYIVGNQKRANDNGEPSGTAGLPMLDVLEKNNLTNIIAIVTRYFGGTLLGTGGLVRAYSSAAKQGLASSVIITKIPGVKLRLATDYAGLGKIQYIFGQRGIKILDSIYTDKVEIAALVPLDVLEAVKAEIREGTNGQAGMEEGEQCYFAEVSGEVLVLDE